MDTVQLSDIRSLLSKAQASIAVALHDLDTKILIGEINRPAIMVEKKLRKKRTPRAKVEDFLPPISPNPVDESLDADHPFYGKKREGKKKEVIVPAKE
jgi:hypothetical protein